MAFVTVTKRGTFEVRESRSTPKGPRSRTLATFTELSPDVIAKARARAAKPPSAEELREAALRVGAPVAGTAVDEAARETLRLLANGAQLDPMLWRLLQDALADGGRRAGEVRPGADAGTRPAPAPPVSDAARAASAWIGVGPAERGRALVELLELADALPVRFRSSEIGFPRLRSI